MKKVIAGIAAGCASVLLCAGTASAADAQLTAPASLAAPAVTATAARLPVVYSQPDWQGKQVRPAHFFTITGDSSEWLNTPHWRHWTSTFATSSGRYAYRSCFGGCDKFKTVKAFIKLWRVRSHGSTRYFTRLQWAYTIKGHRHTVRASFAPHDRGVLWIRQK